MDAMLEKLRRNPPREIGGFAVQSLTDYKEGRCLDLPTGQETGTTLPVSNVLYFELEQDAWFCVRPSGTEPKIKYYAGVKGADEADAGKKMETLGQAILAL